MRKGKLDDCESIIKLIRDLTTNNSVDETRDPSLGLVKCQISSELLNEALKSKEAYITILEGEENRIIGVMIGYQKNFLQKKYFQNDQIVQHLLANIRYDFVYADILIVAKDQLKSGYERMLFMSYLDDTKKNTLLFPVQNSPVENIASKKLMRSFRIKLETEISVYDGLNFEIYEYDN